MYVRAAELKCRHHEAELRQSREECWACEQEVAAAREKLAHLKTTLDDRRKDVVSYKVTKLIMVQKVGFLWLLGDGSQCHKQHMSIIESILTSTVSAPGMLSCPQERQTELDLSLPL